MQYMTQWRMQVAAGLLRDTKTKVIEVALAAGYESEAAAAAAVTAKASGTRRPRLR